MKRSASAQWQGDLPNGSGVVHTPSGVLADTAYSFKTRFEEGVTGTNPEELLAAAHAGCFSMALSHELASAGHTPKSVATQADLDFQKESGGWSVKSIHLAVEADVPGITPDKFQELAEKAKNGCPISRALSVQITMDAKLGQ